MRDTDVALRTHCAHLYEQQQQRSRYGRRTERESESEVRSSDTRITEWACSRANASVAIVPSNVSY